MKKQRQTVESGIGYKIYYYDGLFFVDFYRTKSDGFETLQGAIECVYYAGLRETKEI